MEDEVRQYFRSVGRSRLKGIWRRVKAGQVEDLRGEERLFARVMADHREAYFDAFEMADGRLLDPDSDTDAYLHVSLHVDIEKQLSQKTPIEAVKLYHSLMGKKIDRHEVIHLLVAVFVPFLFDVLKSGAAFDTEGYRRLLAKAKTCEPDGIWELLDRDVYGEEDDAVEDAAGIVYRLRIELEDIDPPIWRDLLIPGDFSFSDLHAAIQTAMGWKDRHHHRFEIREPSTGKMRFIGRPMEDADWEDNVLPGWQYGILDVIGPGSPVFVYVYDYGENWRHRVAVEETLAREPDRSYPACLAGARACPPEEVGGPAGYADLLRILKDPGHERYGEIRRRVGDFDPERFDPARVIFSASEQ